MRNFTLRTFAVLTLTLAALSGCTSHCTCPQPAAPVEHTTVIHEPRDY